MTRITTETDPGSTGIKTLEIDPDDIVNALQACLNTGRNDQELKISESALTGELSYKVVQKDPGLYYPNDVSNPPIHKTPKAFITESPASGNIPYLPTRADARDAVESEHHSDENVDECYIEMLDVWADLVKRELVDEIELRGETVAVELTGK